MSKAEIGFRLIVWWLSILVLWFAQVLLNEEDAWVEDRRRECGSPELRWE